MEKILVNVDSAPDFTKDVSSLFQTNPSSRAIEMAYRGTKNEQIIDDG